MWEELKIYKQLEKKDINSTFRQFGKSIISFLDGYTIDQTDSIIKISRQVNLLEQSIFIEKDSGSYNLEVNTCIKPIDFYKKHKFSMINIVPLGEILNNFRRTFYPLTNEWNDLAFFLSSKIKNEIENYFQKYNSYQKIIERNKEIEPKDFGLYNKYELLIYAAIRTKNKSLLLAYLDKKISRPVMRITKSEYIKSNNQEIDEKEFLEKIKTFAQIGNYSSIETEIASIVKKN